MSLKSKLFNSTTCIAMAYFCLDADVPSDLLWGIDSLLGELNRKIISSVHNYIFSNFVCMVFSWNLYMHFSKRT
jgi:hypothetical protein